MKKSYDKDLILKDGWEVCFRKKIDKIYKCELRAEKTSKSNMRNGELVIFDNYNEVFFSTYIQVGCDGEINNDRKKLYIKCAKNYIKNFYEGKLNQLRPGDKIIFKGDLERNEFELIEIGQGFFAYFGGLSFCVTYKDKNGVRKSVDYYPNYDGIENKYNYTYLEQYINIVE